MFGLFCMLRTFGATTFQAQQSTTKVFSFYRGFYIATSYTTNYAHLILIINVNKYNVIMYTYILMYMKNEN